MYIPHASSLFSLVSCNHISSSFQFLLFHILSVIFLSFCLASRLNNTLAWSFRLVDILSRLMVLLSSTEFFLPSPNINVFTSASFFLLFYCSCRRALFALFHVHKYSFSSLSVIYIHTVPCSSFKFHTLSYEHIPYSAPHSP
ncbi:hypothetical protein CPB84DRAFT_223573 [Gymnopilus junonius]|uniref:Uncharacterized protein n=1 Tax=Gymnopilus junonius TaxID=109634 RepID=A0A9P5NCM0_GYMJU|nr:hypothetical protein CPB84DRAFT_223573 [Gymnopilus junonius]